MKSTWQRFNFKIDRRNSSTIWFPFWQRFKFKNRPGKKMAALGRVRVEINRCNHQTSNIVRHTDDDWSKMMGFHSPFAPLASCPREISIVCIYFIFSSLGQGEKKLSALLLGRRRKSLWVQTIPLCHLFGKTRCWMAVKKRRGGGELTNDDPSHTTPANGNK